MRDLVWTLIVIWLVYQLVNIFKKKPVGHSFSEQGNNTTHSNFNSSNSNNQDKIKNAVHKQADKAGDYVDFEEIK